MVIRCVTFQHLSIVKKTSEQHDLQMQTVLRERLKFATALYPDTADSAILM